MAGAGLEQELELVEARAGSPEATCASSGRWSRPPSQAAQTLLTLPAFVHRAIDAEEVALYELEATTTCVAPRSRGRAARARATFQVERVPGHVRDPRAARRSARSPGPRSPACWPPSAPTSVPEAHRAPAGAYAVVPLLWAGRPHGLIAVRTRRELTTERLRLLELLARQTMAVFTAQPESGSPAAVQALAAAIEARDNYTHDHSEQVVSLATDVAKLLGLSPAEQDAVRHGALLHDVGKLAIPNEILHKPGPLDRRRVARDGRAPGDRRADPAPHAAARRTWRRSCATSTSAGTATATPTAWPARRSRSRRGSSSPATPTTR